MNSCSTTSHDQSSSAIAAQFWKYFTASQLTRVSVSALQPFFHTVSFPQESKHQGDGDVEAGANARALKSRWSEPEVLIIYPVALFLILALFLMANMALSTDCGCKTCPPPLVPP